MSKTPNNKKYGKKKGSKVKSSIKISKERKTVHGNNLNKKEKWEKFGGTGEFNFTFDNQKINKKIDL